MSEISEAIQAKCLAFSDRIIKLNDYLLKEAANKKPAYKISQITEDVVAQLPYVGHVFRSDSCRFYLGKERWNLAEWILSSKRVDTVQSERGHYASPGKPRINR